MPTDAASRWRALAQEIRARAEQMTTGSAAKRTMISIALGYEHLAQRAENAGRVIKVTGARD